MSRVKITEEFLLEQVNLNKSFKQIAEENGWNASSVSDKARKLGIKSGFIPYHDLSGKEFGQLKVLELDKEKAKSNQDTKAYWRCECSCGNIVTISSSSLTGRNKTRSCGCYSPNWKGFGLVSGAYLNFLRHSAIARGILFNITVEDIWKKYEIQNGICAISGVDINFNRDYTKSREKQTASVDRIDCNLPYIASNIQIVHKTVNRMRHYLSIDDFINYCKLIAFPVMVDNRIILRTPKFRGHNWKGSGNLSHETYSLIKKTALRKGILFDVKIDDLWNMYVDQNGCCNLTKLPIFFWDTNVEQTASLDRIDSNKGYTLDNVCWLHKSVNLIKTNLTVKELKSWCIKISNKYKKDKI